MNLNKYEQMLHKEIIKYYQQAPLDFENDIKRRKYWCAN